MLDIFPHTEFQYPVKILLLCSLTIIEICTTDATMLKARFKEVDKIRKKFFKFSGLKKKKTNPWDLLYVKSNSICLYLMYIGMNF